VLGPEADVPLGGGVLDDDCHAEALRHGRVLGALRA